jgi:hypothetical protein
METAAHQGIDHQQDSFLAFTNVSVNSPSSSNSKSSFIALHRTKLSFVRHFCYPRPSPVIEGPLLVPIPLYGYRCPLPKPNSSNIEPVTELVSIRPQPHPPGLQVWRTVLLISCLHYHHQVFQNLPGLGMSGYFASLTLRIDSCLVDRLQLPSAGHSRLPRCSLIVFLREQGRQSNFRPYSFYHVATGRSCVEDSACFMA